MTGAGDHLLPVLRHHDAAIVAWRGGVARNALHFRRDVAALAAMLPDAPTLLNLCQDRYRFMVGFAAALLRGQVTLMPSATTPRLLQDLAATYRGLYALTDATPPDLPHTIYPDDLPAAAPADLRIPAAQPALVQFTSGSTGQPRPVPKSWSTLVESARAAGARLDAARMQGGCVVGTVPHQHSYGLESVILLAWQHGLAVSAASPLFANDVRAALAAAPSPRVLVTTPVHLRALAADPGGMPGVDLVLSATAPLPVDLARQAEACFGAPLIEIYGCTEAGQIATRRSSADDVWHCFDNVTLHQTAEGWWASGAAVEGLAPVQDVIEPVGPGRFRLGSRSADLVNIAGKRSSIGYLTHQLLAIPGVQDGTFVMQDDATRLTALVVAPGLSADDILRALRETIDPAFLPRPLIHVDMLPRSHLGKLLRADMLRLAAGGAAP